MFITASMASSAPTRRLVRGILIAIAVLMSACSSGNEGLDGTLSRAAADGATAVTTASYGIELSLRDRATDNQTAVLLADMQDELIAAYGTVAEQDIDVEQKSLSARDLLRTLSEASDLMQHARQLVGEPPGTELTEVITGLSDVGRRLSDFEQNPVSSR